MPMPKRFPRDSASLRLPIDGPPTLETYPFLQLPPAMPEPGRAWEVADPDFGPQVWKTLLTEFRERGRCLKLHGQQSAGDWSQAGRLVWRRQEVVWLLLQEGYDVIGMVRRSSTFCQR